MKPSMLVSAKDLQTLFAPMLLVMLVAACATEVAVTTQQVTITVDNATLEFIASDGDIVPEALETFFVRGDVTGYNGEAATGQYYCWGAFTDGAPGTAAGFTAVTQRIQIDGQGTLAFTGAEMSTEPMVVIGGTGAFRGASGTYTVPAMAEAADIDGDGEPEFDSAPQGIDVDGDGDNDGTGHIEFTVDLISAGG